MSRFWDKVKSFMGKSLELTDQPTVVESVEVKPKRTRNPRKKKAAAKKPVKKKPPAKRKKPAAKRPSKKKVVEVVQEFEPPISDEIVIVKEDSVVEGFEEAALTKEVADAKIKD